MILKEASVSCFILHGGMSKCDNEEQSEIDSYGFTQKCSVVGFPRRKIIAGPEAQKCKDENTSFSFRRKRGNKIGGERHKVESRKQRRC
jgi:hypothetical protein